MKPRITVHILWLAITGCCTLAVQRLAAQQSVTLEKIWETDTIFSVPESVYLDKQRKVMYVANIQGKSNEKDGQGYISRLSPDGKVITKEWITGLNAPKGMGIHHNRLYVADLSDIVVVDIEKGSIAQRIPVEDAIFLNDITIDNKGVVYVSDTRKGRLHKLENGQVTTLLEGRKSPNGLLWRPNAFYVLDDGAMFRLEKDGAMTKVADLAPTADGLVEVKPGEYIATCWRGEVFYVDARKGAAVKLLDTQQQQLNTADIDYDPARKILYIPTFNGNKIIAYQVNGR